MLKLYKKEQDGSLYYAEYWINEKTIFLHYGKVGELGETEKKVLVNENEFLKNFTERFTLKGYSKMLHEDYYWIIVQYPIKDMFGSQNDTRLKDKVTMILNEELGWKGLGEVDGYDIGLIANPNRKEIALNIFCIVVDEWQGVSAIKTALQKKGLDKKMKIASRKNNDDSQYELKFSADSKDTVFYS